MRNKTSFKQAQATLELTKQNYEAKLQELSLLEQQADAAQIVGDEAKARELMKQAIDTEQQLSQLDTEIKYLEKTLSEKPQSKPNFLLLLIPIAAIVAGGILWSMVNNKPLISDAQINCPQSNTKLRINGATSMAQINKKLEGLIEAKCSNVNVEIAANGTDIGIEQVIAGNIDIAAVSRPLNAQEQAKGLVATFVKADPIAVIVGKENPFQGGLTLSQLADIFKGNVNNWSAVGGQAGTIRVINRPPISGTYHGFKELILNGAEYGTTPNITTRTTDETTPILQQLKADGISYASYSQVKNQSNVRTIAIDGLMPDVTEYPHKRQLFYVYKQPMSPVAKAFLEYLKSNDIQQAITNDL